MLEAYQTCSLAAHNPFAEGVAGAVRQLGRIPATGESAMFVGMSASVAVAWVTLSMGSRQPRSELRRKAGCARAHARGGAVGTARSRSW